MNKIEKVLIEEFGQPLDNIIDIKCLKYLNKKNKLKSKKHRLTIFFITMEIYDYVEYKLIHDINIDIDKVLEYIDIYTKHYIESKYIEPIHKEEKDIFSVLEIEEDTDFIDFE